MLWEYMTTELETSRAWSSMNHDSVREELNRLGAEGWELVNIFDTNDRSGRTVQLIGVLKRAMD